MSEDLEIGTAPMIRALVSHMFQIRFRFDKAKADEEAHEFIETMKIAKLEICHFPEGHLNQDDEGQLAIAIGTENNRVVVKFGKKIAWMGFDRKAALGFIETFRFHTLKLPVH